MAKKRSRVVSGRTVRIRAPQARQVHVSIGTPELLGFFRNLGIRKRRPDRIVEDAYAYVTSMYRVITLLVQHYHPQSAISIEEVRELREQRNVLEWKLIEVEGERDEQYRSVEELTRFNEQLTSDIDILRERDRRSCVVQRGLERDLDVADRDLQDLEENLAYEEREHDGAARERNDAQRDLRDVTLERDGLRTERDGYRDQVEHVHGELNRVSRQLFDQWWTAHEAEDALRKAREFVVRLCHKYGVGVANPDDLNGVLQSLDNPLGVWTQELRAYVAYRQALNDRLRVYGINVALGQELDGLEQYRTARDQEVAGLTRQRDDAQRNQGVAERQRNEADRLRERAERTLTEVREDLGALLEERDREAARGGEDQERPAMPPLSVETVSDEEPNVFARVCYRWGRDALARGQPTKAVPWFERGHAAARSPLANLICWTTPVNNRSAALEHANALNQAGEYEFALEHLSWLFRTERDPQWHARILDQQAEVYAHLGQGRADYARALECLRQANDLVYDRRRDARISQCILESAGVR